MNFEDQSKRYEQLHRARIEKYARRVASQFDETIRRLALMIPTTGIDPSKPFTFEQYPALNAIFKREQEKLFGEVFSTISLSVKSGWGLSQQKTDELCAFVVQSVGLSGPALKAFNSLLSKNETRSQEALAAFQKRKIDGMNLSDRVWNLADQHKQELEMALDIGIGDGKSAAALSRDVRKHLQQPEKLFRRVRDKHGVLHLSKNAASYHPGRGVYRSSYKNAIRLTGTETNIAYRTADYERYQDLGFVVGMEIKLSNNHPVTDICDSLKGLYPKTFKFVGWHPACRCYQVPVLQTKDEFWDDIDRILDGGDPLGESENAVTVIPANFTAWMGENAGRLKSAGSFPYFIRDNAKVIAAMGGVAVVTKAAMPIAAIQSPMVPINSTKGTATFSESVDSATSLDEIKALAQSELKKLGQDVKITMSENDMDVATAQIFVKRLTELCAEYKTGMPIMSFNTHQSTSKYGYVAALNGDGTVAMTGDKILGNRIGVGKKFDPSRLNTEATIKSLCDPDNAQVSTLTHEFGHSLWTEWNDNEAFSTELLALRSQYYDELRALRTAGKSTDVLYLGQGADLSEYEFMAEAFQEYKNRKTASKYAKAVGGLVDKHFKR